MAIAKRYKVTLQRLYTIEVPAENELEAREKALAHASGEGAPGFQRQSKPIQTPEAIDDEWCAVEVIEIGPDDHVPTR